MPLKTPLNEGIIDYFLLIQYNVIPVYLIVFRKYHLKKLICSLGSNSITTAESLKLIITPLYEKYKIT